MTAAWSWCAPCLLVARGMCLCLRCSNQERAAHAQIWAIQQLLANAQAMREFCCEGAKKMGWDKLASAARLSNSVFV